MEVVTGKVRKETELEVVCEMGSSVYICVQVECKDNLQVK